MKMQETQRLNKKRLNILFLLVRRSSDSHRSEGGNLNLNLN